MPDNKRTRPALAMAAVTVAVAVGAAIPLTVIALNASSAAPAIMGLFGKKPVIHDPGLVLGSYDPHGDFKDDAGVGMEHLFLPWEDVEFSSLTQADAYASERHRKLLITVEPWSWDKDARITPAALRSGIAAGRYDPNISALCTAIGQLKSDVTIRWGQEMEHNIGRFIWAGWKPADYISAYHRFVDHCRPLAPQAKYMWSPRGDKNLGQYYPGYSYADVIGLTVFGLQKMDKKEVGHNRTFADVLKPGYDEAAKLNKPIMVAELGYVGDEAYKTQWADTVTETDTTQFPRLTSVVYFNDKEVYPWPKPYGLPNWRVVNTASIN